MKYFKIFPAAFVLGFFFCTFYSHAETAGVLTYIEGRVDGTKDAAQGYKPLVIEDKVSVGDTLRTKSYSKAEITFADGSMVRMGENSQVTVKDFRIDDLGFRKTASIYIERGSARTVVAKTKDNAPFDISTPNTAGTVKGSDIYVSFLKSSTSVLVDEGVFTALNPAFPGQSVSIGEGKAASIPYNAPPEPPRAFIPVELENMQNITSPTIREIEKSTLKNADTTLAMVVKVSGLVKITPFGAQAGHAPVLNEVLNAGDKVETGDDGRVEITLSSGHIIELRANTCFIIEILKRDPKSGAYENLFECKFGKIRAKLQKIQQGSSFQVKTPTAVCGVRGTIMYLNVTPTNTESFYEGGTGYVTGTATGETQDVPPGNSASVGSDGDVSDPAPTSDEQRQEFGSDWGGDSGSGDEMGYSDSGGSGDDLGGGGDDLGGDGLGDGGTDPADDDLTKPLTDEDIDDPDGTETPEETVHDQDIVYAGDFFPNEDQSEGGTNYDDVNYLTGNGTLTVNNGAWADAAGSSDIFGEYSQPSNDSRNIGFGVMSADYKPGDNGNFYGWLTISSGSTEDSWIGHAAAIYMDDTGDYGTMTIRYDGTHERITEEGVFPETGTFGGKSTDLVITARENGGDILPEDLEDHIVKTDMSGSLKGYFEGESGKISSDDVTYKLANLCGADWGIWGLYMSGAGGREGEGLPDKWDLTLMGMANNGDEKSLWLGKMEGEENGNDGAFIGGTKFFVFTPRHGEDNDSVKYLIGGLQGEHNDGEGNDEWVAGGVGTWTDVASLTDLTGAMKSVYNPSGTDLYDSLNTRIDDKELVLTHDLDVSMYGEAYFNDDKANHEINVSSLSVGLYAYSPNYYSEGWMIMSICGSFRALGKDQWTIDLKALDGQDWLKFNGLKFSDGKWFAVVEGYLHYKDLAGVASGTYWYCDDAETWKWSGDGVGSWTWASESFSGEFNLNSFAGNGNYAIGSSEITANLDSWEGIATGSVSGTFNQLESNQWALMGPITGDGGAQGDYYGNMVTASGGTKDTWLGYMAALYIDGNGEAGTIYGKYTGTHDDAESGNFEGTALSLDVVSKSGSSYNAEELDDEGMIETSGQSGELKGAFTSDGDSGTIFTESAEVSFQNISGEEWGIWSLSSNGTSDSLGSGPTWDIAIRALTKDKDGERSIWLGKMTGEDLSNDSNIDASAEYFVFRPEHEDSMPEEFSASVRYLTGNFVGEHYGKGNDIWTIGGVGLWDEIDGMSDLSAPIDLVDDLRGNIDTLVDESALYSVGSLNINSECWDISGKFTGDTGSSIDVTSVQVQFYAYAPYYYNEGWWKIDCFEGTYNGTSDNNWTLNFSGYNEWLKFYGLRWIGTKWFALVQGFLNGKDLAGVASGAYAENADGLSGTLTGSAVGAWTAYPADSYGGFSGNYVQDYGSSLDSGGTNMGDYSAIGGYFTLTTNTDFWGGTAAAMVSGTYMDSFNSFIAFSAVEGDVDEGNGDYYGYMGLSDSGSRDTFTGRLALLYIDADGKCGTITGTLDGEKDSISYLFESTSSDLTVTQHDTKTLEDLSPYDLDYLLNEQRYDGYLNGYFRNDGGSIDDDGDTYFYFANLGEEKWGIWGLETVSYGGEMDGASTVFDMTVRGGFYEQGYPAYYLGKITGNDIADLGDVTTIEGKADILSYSFSNGENDDSIKILTGKTTGEYDIEGESWTTVSTGEWVEVTELVDFTDLINLTGELASRVNELAEMNQLTQIDSFQLNVQSQPEMPIGQFEAGGIVNSMVVDMRIFSDNLWNMDINNSTYSGDTSNNWFIQLNGESYVLNFDGLQWENGQWFATINGNVNSLDILGTVGGTYDEATHTFIGSGAGAWQEQQQV